MTKSFGYLISFEITWFQFMKYIYVEIKVSILKDLSFTEKS